MVSIHVGNDTPPGHGWPCFAISRHPPIRVRLARRSPLSLQTVEVDRDSSVPPYEQIAAQIRAAIADGTYPPGSRLPSVLTIMQETGVAALTARKALRVLTAAGEAVMRPGWGTFAAGPQ